MKVAFFTAIKVVIVIFALIGFAFLAAYVGVNLHLTDTSGIVDSQSDVFWQNSRNSSSTAVILNGEDSFFNKENYCSLKILKKEYGGEFRRIINLAFADKKELAQKNLDAVTMTLGVSTGGLFADFRNSCILDFTTNASLKSFEDLADMTDIASPFAWASSSEWTFFKMGVLKDKDVLKRVENETGIKSRILVAELMSEQMRLYFSDRAWFEKAISPVKVLASMSQFSLGVLGIKQETAKKIEDNLKATTSPFYLGPEFENVLDFKTADINAERFKRITDYHDHYYAYLYAALYDKQIITQWQKSGVDISNRPEVLATLYNIGFVHSSPNLEPKMGGASLMINGTEYSFGRLAYEFYYSGELLEDFPQ
ncbi:MAG: hypothetical protein NTV72_01745 [Candidatus Taylorbacteria bacterium]|nr:hypothetical protein [Candidatus Taylorbacteria bacterium]